MYSMYHTYGPVHTHTHIDADNTETANENVVAPTIGGLVALCVVIAIAVTAIVITRKVGSCRKNSLDSTMTATGCVWYLSS